MANSLENRKFFYIYKTTNLVNGKYYLGMHTTSNIKDGYLGSGTVLRRSIRKYGKENFKCEILEYCKDRGHLALREKEIVTEEILKDPMCMNLINGGFGWNSHAAKVANLQSQKKLKQLRLEEDWKIKNKNILSKARLKEYKNGKRNKKYFYDWNGKKHSKETKKKISDKLKIAQKGQLNSQYGTCWITNEVENKKIKKGSLIPDGWRLGRTTIHL